MTRIARRKFAFAREVAGYHGVVEGVGQEPINAVYYYHDGDQYRPHCDGECHGGAYTLGSRVASSLAYCLTADKGGFTLFTRSGLKVCARREEARTRRPLSLSRWPFLGCLGESARPRRSSRSPSPP